SMPARRNSSRFYDAKSKKPAGVKQGVRSLGVVSQNDATRSDTTAAVNTKTDATAKTESDRHSSTGSILFAALSLTMLGGVIVLRNRKRRVLRIR
ncbi:MAG: hypothetical protein IID45_12115, partial [Planctomycetes bacterium]|nr:hypothetical protein [Planctomycetota bacterium]